MNAREAVQVVVDLFTKYNITSVNERYRIRAEFTQEDLDEYQKALELIDGQGLIG